MKSEGWLKKIMTDKEKIVKCGICGRKDKIKNMELFDRMTIQKRYWYCKKHERKDMFTQFMILFLALWMVLALFYAFKSEAKTMQTGRIPMQEFVYVPTVERYVLTAYTCDVSNEKERMMNCPNGITASGTEPVSGLTIACDPSMLGESIRFWGKTYKCEDTGGAIKGNRIDIYMDTMEEALKFGRREIIID